MMDYLGMLLFLSLMFWPWLLAGATAGAVLGYIVASWRHGP